MAVYRHIHIDYWQDGFVLDLTPEEKYFYIYLMTNSKTTQCGIYELPKRIIETETGYNRETVEKLLARFEEYGKIVYSEDSKEIFIKNWLKHNKVVSPKVKKCVEKELSNVKSMELINLFLKECYRYGYTLDSLNINTTTPMDTHTTDESIPMDSVSIPIAKVENKLEHGYGEKEKQKQKEKEKQKEEEKEVPTLILYKTNKFEKIRNLYESKIGAIEGNIGEWLFEVCETVETGLFERALEIAVERNKKVPAYIKGILKKWDENGITTLEDLKKFEIERKLRGDRDNGNCENYRKPKYAREYEDENDDFIYRAPSQEQLEEIRRIIRGEDS
ncbi:DnaD domain protein [Romboutsia sp.]|uniref:DnaD domain protein n=1 Tax=Romboutsia sp. TaxID=1965302 RepID=UPI003F2A6426